MFSFILTAENRLQIRELNARRFPSKYVFSTLKATPSAKALKIESVNLC